MLYVSKFGLGVLSGPVCMPGCGLRVVSRPECARLSSNCGVWSCVYQILV